MKFCVGVSVGSELVGVAIVGRPVARGYQDGFTLEVTRTVTDGTKNVNSMLYGASWRAAKALGYRRLITYTQAVRVGYHSRHQAGRSWLNERREQVGTRRAVPANRLERIMLPALCGKPDDE